MNTVRKRVAGAMLGIALLAATLAGPVVTSAATKPTLPTPYPWSRVLGGTTGDYFADSYNGVSAGHVFENTTTDRLLDILSSNGSYYIVLSGPEHASGQKALSVINAQAKVAGVTKIYHWDPYLDGYKLDSTDGAGIGTMQGGTSVNSTGAATISEPWRLISELLPPSATQPGGVLYDYKGDTTLLLLVKITDRTDPVNGKAILSSWSLADADAAAFDPASAAAGSAVRSVFFPAPANVLVPSSARSEYEFFKRVYRASATYVETRTGASKDRIGAAVDIFSDTDFPGGAGFVLNSVDLKEFFNLANSPGEKVFFFAGNGCHNTQAIIGSVATEAKRLGTRVVYVVDFSLSSNVKFDTGANIDNALNSTATGGLWVRRSAVASETLTYPQYGYSYLYGELVKYLDPGFITENSSKQNNSIAYYPNGDFTSVLTTKAPWATDLAAGEVPNAKRLQVPFLIRYDKDAPQPVIGKWLHKTSSNDGTYTEYMLELAWVRQTQASLEASQAYVDGLSRTAFAAEAVAALRPVLEPKSIAAATARTVSSMTYTGAALKPAVTVVFNGRTLANGIDYSLAYSNNVKVGRATITVTGKGVYGGTKTVTFAIDPKPTSIRKIYAGYRKITVYWTKLSGTTRYEINYRSKGSTTWKTTSASASTDHLTISQLRRGKTYQVRVRRYQNVSGVKYYSSWSSTKTSGTVR